MCGLERETEGTKQSQLIQKGKASETLAYRVREHNQTSQTNIKRKKRGDQITIEIYTKQKNINRKIHTW